MRFIADLHIHSHFSVATSKDLIPEKLDYWARIKGITVVGTGDFTHPGWLKELKEKLEPAEDGLFKLKEELRLPGAPDTPVRFLLSAEISSIYKKNNKVRKIHNVILAPDFESVEQMQARLSRIGNITSDGRPILGLDAKDLLELTLEVNEDNFFIPAHIWTPWFSALGSKSGFDSIEECFEDLTQYIYAVETGLSSDPPMNWLCSFLDRFTLISNSDAHSPEKLGREANIFQAELSYRGIIEALKNPDSQKFAGTVEFYPQEGKYHLDGHRKCGVRWDPLQTLQNKGICPVCGKKVTVGVLNRVAQLSDREEIEELPGRKPFYSLIPLKEALSEILQTGPNTKTVDQAYQALIQKAGSEFNLLLNLPLDEIKQMTNELVHEAIRRMRERRVIVKEGFDGEFGRIRVFGEGETAKGSSQQSLFNDLVAEPQTQYHLVKPIPFDLKKFRALQKEAQQAAPSQASLFEFESEELLLKDLNAEQKAAVKHFRGPAIVLAGPGTGKTRVLTRRIAYLIQNGHVPAQEILAVTFTNKAAQEIRQRVADLIRSRKMVKQLNIGTFHALGYQILNENAALLNRQAPIAIFDAQDRKKILKRLAVVAEDDLESFNDLIGKIKLFLVETPEDETLQLAMQSYADFLESQNAVDLEDLIYLTVQLLRSHDDLLKAYRHRFKWILVDEYQDLNRGQYELLKLLAAGSEPNLFVIGDPDQAIYGFRGADVHYITRFETDFQKARSFRLKISYRCSDSILQASASMLYRGKGGGFLEGLHKGLKIRLVEEASEKSEAEFVARTIEEMMGGLRFFSMDSAITQGNQAQRIQSLSDFAILVRLKAMIPVLEKALNDHGIPYQVVGHDSWLHEEPVRSVIEILRCTLAGQSYYLKEGAMARDVNGQDWQMLEQLVAEQKTVSELLELISIHFVQPQSPKEKKRLKRLFELAAPFGKDTPAFLQWAFLGHGQDLYAPQTEQVTLMTLHAAKGLEFNAVFIVGCEQGLLPYAIFKEQAADVEEERRLLYVGMTRAMHYLFLTHARRRFLFGQTYQLPRSQFLDAIEQELIEARRAERPPKRKKDDGQLSLFDF
ncbi:UvrD/REP helicase [Caldithrix abyssi DSM 13497]|uniref:DNA 3'-5' helicase n=1 Tax=Caldithrix abyssi DSM 13497 TaxID=880073 RepID=H1XTJ4_CALAY|nr:UvrD-helicase domain-containing protein [Caldithrix abyssi]APF17357.1 TIGR00375 family protein [Caldithrix abyssi DSM 13497]EHO41469.1 UvrD/REP helicase [Caldithrix abyssi DSM 13497]